MPKSNMTDETAPNVMKPIAVAQVSISLGRPVFFCPLPLERVGVRALPLSAKECLERAESCEAFAETALNSESRAIFLDLAKRWRILAGKPFTPKSEPAEHGESSPHPSE